MKTTHVNVEIVASDLTHTKTQGHALYVKARWEGQRERDRLRRDWDGRENA